MDRFNWRVFWILTGLGTLGVIALIPAALTRDADRLADLPIPLAVLLPLQVLQSAVFIGVAVGVGLWLGKRIGLGAPVLETLTSRQSAGPLLRSILRPALVLGAAVGVVIVALDAAVFAPQMPEPLRPQQVVLPLWQEFLARAFYGSITEEIFTRLGLLTVIAWLVGKVMRGPDGRPTVAAFWTANVAAALLFGAGHLPATAALFPLTELVVARAILLNGLAGLAFGHLYWTRGIEAAMIGHFAGGMILLAGARVFG
jgi:hypothetical protein